MGAMFFLGNKNFTWVSMFYLGQYVLFGLHKKKLFILFINMLNHS
jgi:hypothetical protein